MIQGNPKSSGVVGFHRTEQETHLHQHLGLMDDKDTWSLKRASDAKSKRAVKAESSLSDIQQLNTYFPFYYEADFTRISIRVKEPEWKTVKAYLDIKLDLTLTTGYSPFLIQNGCPLADKAHSTECENERELVTNTKLFCLFMWHCIIKYVSLLDLLQKPLKLNLNNLQLLELITDCV